MEIKDIHPLNIGVGNFRNIQECLLDKVVLKNTMIDKEIKLCAGVDVAYWEAEGIEWGVCSIIVINYETKAFVEKTYYTEKVTFPYIPGYLALRELPLIIKTAKMLSCSPDLFMFDGNGYLLPIIWGLRHTPLFFLISRPLV